MSNPSMPIEVGQTVRVECACLLGISGVSSKACLKSCGSGTSTVASGRKFQSFIVWGCIKTTSIVRTGVDSIECFINYDNR